MTYRIDYTGEDSDNGSGATLDGQHLQPVYHYPYPPKRGFRIPAIIKSAATFVLGGAVLCAMEIAGPAQFRPSTVMGTYDSRIEEQVKSAEMRVQGRYEGWAVLVKARAEQNVEQYKTKTALMLSSYQAGVDRAKIFAQLTGQLQSQLTGAQLSRAGGEISGEVGLVSLGRMLGNIANVIEPGSGDGMRDWAKETSTQLQSELDNAVINGRQVSIEGWDTGLPNVGDLQRQIDDIKPLEIPPMPSLGLDENSGR